jgi:UDP-galactopyranose mutase
LLLFARNESTRFISPTKTPEYLAAGKPVISTSIRDVVRPYGDLKLVEIADTPDEFIAAAEKILSRRTQSDWLARVDAFIQGISWDKTWAQMSDLIDGVIERKRPARSASVAINGASSRAGAAAST